MLERIPFRYFMVSGGIPAAILVTALFGGNVVDMLLAPIGGVAAGLAAAYTVLQGKNLPLSATLGDYQRAIQKMKTPQS